MSDTTSQGDTTSQQLLAALQPKGGMKRIQFPLSTYDRFSKPISSKQLINLLAEKQSADARTAAALIATPGLEQYGAYAFGTGPVWAVNSDMPGRLYVASGDHFYRVSYPPGPPSGVEDMGVIGSPTTRPDGYVDMVTIAAGSTAAVVCVPPNCFTCGHNSGDPLNQITGTFPGAASVGQMDGYFAFTEYANSAQWFTSYLLDPTMYSALDFVYADSVPNVIRRIIGHQGDWWVLGEHGIEIWYNAGKSDFPFRRQSGGVIYQGVYTAKSVCTLDNSVWWLGADGVVYRSNGYKAKRVSTHYIEEFTQGVGFAAVTCSMAYVHHGHQFYALTLAGKTFVYDVLTEAWHERSSSADGSQPWRPYCAAQAAALLVFGDGSSGQLMTLNEGLGTDMGTALLRRATLPPVWNGTKRAFCARLEIGMETGGHHPTENVTLDWSNDGGWTYTGGPRVMSPGYARVYATRLGSFRERVFRMSTVGGVPTFYDVYADMQSGEN